MLAQASESADPAPVFAWSGSASCASMACHNADGPRGAKGSEYSTWVTFDPHARAYTILLGDRSRQIEKNYRQHRTLAEAHAEQDALCLRCHALDPKAAPDAGSELLTDGVGCENCHGPSSQWRAEHYLADWKQLTPAAKEARGMRSTKDLLVRARLCVDCHVGAPGREVNHDLIAAGHPRLQFEYGAFLAVMPKHWSERAEKTRYPDFEARAWAIGQAASARAALSLLAERADPAQAKSHTWPEFAEYDCFACHHSLQGQSWRQERDLAKPPSGPGAPRWGTWYFPLLPQALTARGHVDRPQVLTVVEELRRAMDRARPDRARVTALARDAATQLAPLVQRTAQARYDDNAGLTDLFGRIARDDRKIAGANWDGAAQVYLALAALYHAQGDLFGQQRDPSWRGPLEVMRDELAFPRSPGVRYDGPDEAKYLSHEKRFLQALETLRKRLD
jgi:hypothetical protein